MVLEEIRREGEQRDVEEKEFCEGFKIQVGLVERGIYEAGERKTSDASSEEKATSSSPRPTFEFLTPS